MERINWNKLVLFGAGKIGRSFIGQLFSRGGYEVVFIDSYKPVIDELNRRGNYKLIIKSEKEDELLIRNVRGVFAGDVQPVIHEIATAGILAVSIGQGGLPGIMPLLAGGLLLRSDLDPKAPMDIIIAENLRNAAEYFKTALEKLLPAEFPFEQQLGLVETSIGKMVPIMLRKDIEEDILQIFAEPYNTLILDKKAFRNTIPVIDGLAPKENMKAWVDRKLFIHNLGHATAAYLGYLFNPGFIFLYEALDNREILEAVRNTMLQSADVLLKKYPDEFTIKSLTEHIDDLLFRFRNKALGDTIFRVGCDLKRKLAADDRLSGAIRLAIELKLPYDRILYSLVCGCHFRQVDEAGNMFPDDVDFVELYQQGGILQILQSICGFNGIEYQELLLKANHIDEDISVASESRNNDKN
jgi:mannitol-1-phosphate 5-dehydrogenase